MSEAQNNRRKRWGRWLLLIVLAVLLLLKFFVLDIYTVPQAGMVPTLSAHSRFLGWKHPYRNASQVHRGDVIVFWRDLPDGKRYQFVWRVVGLPGDRVELAGDTVRINGQSLPREQIRADSGLVIYREHNGPVSYEVAYPAPVAESPAAPDVSVTVPPGEFFTLGDNRHSARDSRFDGTVPFDHIVAKKF
jgi:signal peptidase I